MSLHVKDKEKGYFVKGNNFCIYDYVYIILLYINNT